MRFDLKRGAAVAAALGIFGGFSAEAPAQSPMPCNPCPQLMPIPCPPNQYNPNPSTPATPTTPKDSTTPTNPGVNNGNANLNNNANANAFAQGAETGGLSSNSFTPNMMGDVLGARSIRFQYSAPLSLTFTNPGTAQNGVQVTPSNGSAIIGPLPNGSQFSTGQLNQLLGLNPYFQALVNGQAPASQTLAAQTLLQAAFSGQNLTAQQLQMLAALPPNVQAKYLNSLNSQITQATNGLAIRTLTVGPVTGQLLQNGNLQYSSTLTGYVNVAFPGASSTVGRVKMSEDNSPLPMDRFIFNYDYFEHVPYTTNGINVNRFSVGAEKTFLDGRASFEIRLPFAETLASTTTQGAESTGSEIGNLRLALKYLWLRGEYVSLTSGLGVTLPTANDTVMLNSLTNSPLYHFENQSVQIEPYVAVLFTPTDRLFGQVWTSINFDASGGELTWDPAVFGGSGSQRIWDLPILSVDAQLGYWLLKSDYGRLRGLAPFVELHWNEVILQNRLASSVNDKTLPQGLNVATTGNTELNLTLGGTARFYDNWTLTIGGTVPLLQDNNRTFDAQVGVRVNYYFGQTGREHFGPVNNY